LRASHRILALLILLIVFVAEAEAASSESILWVFDTGG